MSELIDNVSKERQNKLKAFIFRLHNGEDKENVEAEFKQEFKYVTGSEIAQMEYNLVQEGVSVEEIQNLCDVHASLFQGNVYDLHKDVLTVNPLLEFEEENEEIRLVLNRIVDFRTQAISNDSAVRFALLSMMSDLKPIEDHYAKKENVLFPYLEKSGDFVISKVMWGVDTKIRKAFKKALEKLENESSMKSILKEVDHVLQMIGDMITKENQVLFPMLRDKLNDSQFKEIANSLNQEQVKSYTGPKELNDDVIAMSMGALSSSEANAIFNTLPFDLTFVDANNKVKFVSQGKERIFDRPISVIGRPVDLCHPPQSVDIVMKIVEDLRSGRKDHEDFWIQFKENFVFIRYFAVRDEQGEFLGTLEVTQSLNEIRQLKGEKRLASQA